MPISDYTPALADVGAVTLGRTVNDVGVVTGTFSATTRPTDTIVNILIARAASDVSLEIGTDIPADLQDDAKQVAAYRTAMLIELTQFGVEVATDRSPYPQYKELYEAQVKRVMNAIAAEEAGADVRNQVDGPYARYDYGLDSDWMTRRM